MAVWAAEFYSSDREDSGPLNITRFAEEARNKDGRVPSSWFLHWLGQIRIADIERHIDRAASRRVWAARLKADWQREDDGSWTCTWENFTPPAAREADALGRGLRDLIREVLKENPSITRQEILALAKEALPATRGGARGEHRRPRLDPHVVVAALRALEREHPTIKQSVIISDLLAPRLRVSPRTVETLLASARK